MATNRLYKFREDVLKGAQQIYAKGLVENGEGNISIRINKNEIFVTPTSVNYDQLTPESFIHMDLDGNVLDGSRMPSTEVKLHLAIYRARPKVKSVIHDHSTYATILSVLRKSIPIIMEQQIIFLGGEIKCTEITEAHTEEMGPSAIKALDINNAAILANHGAVVCGKSVEHAVRFAVLLEKIAKVYWGSLKIGNPLEIPEENTKEHYKLFYQLNSSCPRSMLKKNE